MFLCNACIFVAVFTVVAFAYISWDGKNDVIFPADVALVLASKVRNNGQCTTNLAKRLNRAVGLYKQGLCKVIIVSGGIDRNGHDEVQVMLRYLVSKGIPAKAIVPDSNGKNTRASAQFSAAYMQEKGLKNILVVSQFFHMTRAKLALRSAGVSTVIGTAHAQHFQKNDPQAILREVAGVVAYSLGLR